MKIILQVFETEIKYRIHLGTYLFSYVLIFLFGLSMTLIDIDIVLFPDYLARMLTHR